MAEAVVASEPHSYFYDQQPALDLAQTFVFLMLVPSPLAAESSLIIGSIILSSYITLGELPGYIRYVVWKGPAMMRRVQG